MSLIFKDYKINHIALLFIKVLTLSQKQVKIQNWVLRSVELITRSIEKWRNSSQRFCLVRLIFNSCWTDRNQHSIGRKEFSIDRNSQKLNFSRILQQLFLTSSLFFHQKQLLILSMRIYRSNIRVFNIKIKNHNNARNVENIILISLGINCIILALTYCLIIK